MNDPNPDAREIAANILITAIAFIMGGLFVYIVMKPSFLLNPWF